MRTTGYAFLLLSILAVSCRSGRTGTTAAPTDAGSRFVADTLFANAHLGVTLFDPATGKYLFDHQGDRYFVPASNTKIVSCYVAMMHLGDSIPAMEWKDAGDAIILRPTGDPTFLHPDYGVQPVADFLRVQTKKLYIDTSAWQEQALGAGWSWDDYNDDYMAERSPLPVFGNVIRWHQARTKKENPQYASDTIDTFIYSEPDLNWPVDISPPSAGGRFHVQRDLHANSFTATEGAGSDAVIDVPFLTHGVRAAIELLQDTVHREIMVMGKPYVGEGFTTLFSRPVDSMLKPMMHRSDNFFAEQSLLMVGRKLTGRFNDDTAISWLLSHDLKELPQKPAWVDGSGLSRYNLFTPRDFVWVLDRMKKDAGWARITGVFASGGTGTLRNYYRSDSTRIYAKTGSLSGVLALSGYLVTKGGKTLIFSILINNNRGPAGPIRLRTQDFLHELIEEN
jgi:D-alanyl-D-alanine carboxypeptidase/D-alanyl-D-alanine-endopeptidase (penicillin-binding protein 4)